MMNSDNSWVVAWCNSLGFPQGMPEWIYALISLLCTYSFVVVPAATLISYFDRKLSADLQARVGPNRAGPGGLFQPLADLLKLLQKETRKEWSWRENLWLSVHTMALYSTLAVMPLGSVALLVDTEMSAFLPFWSALVLALGTMLLGLSQGSVPGWFGGIRVAAQTLAGSFPALVALLCAGVHAGSFRWSILAKSQGFSPWTWTCMSNPFQAIAFVVFVMSGLVLLAIPPLDGGLSMSDIHGGVSSHLYGRRLSLFKFGRFYGFFFWCVIAVVLFLGAWVIPYRISDGLRQSHALLILAIIELSWLLTKTFTLMLFIVWVARVNPRSRVDQITDFAWKVLSPFALASLVGSAIWAGWRAFS
jgi:NADH-quinone oxidoreductase subunit H